MRKLYSFALLWTLLSLVTANSYAQGTGYIIRPTTSSATSVKAAFDPNGDGYTSKTPSGYAGDDVTNSELPFKPVSALSLEPFGDLRRGPSHLFSDFVPDAAGNGYYAHFDGTNLLFRFRMGSLIPGAKGYSVLIDTDGRFGASGTTADPNFQAATTGTNGNPGFEIEIVLETGKQLAIYNVDGVGASVAPATAFANWQDHSQVSIAGTYDNGDPDFFLDFYVPFSVLQAAPFNLTAATQLRMVATTVMSPQGAIGGPKSDIYGVSDSDYPAAGDQYTAIINAQSSFTPSTLSGTGTTPVGTLCTAAPTINAPIGIGTVTISGTWTMSALSGAATTTTITVYNNGAQVGTINNVASGATWSLPSVSVANSDVITAKAQSTGESMCLVSNAVTALSCTNANRPSLPVLTCANNYGKGITGNNLATGWVVYVENLTRGTVESTVSAPSQFTTSGTSPNITWNYAGGCSGGPNMPSGTYKIYYMNSSGCVSEPFFFCLASGTGAANNLAGTAATPTITAPLALTPGTSTITGSGEPNGAVTIYVDGTARQTVTATAAGAFTFTNLSLTTGQQVYITNVLNTGTVNTSKCFASSSTYTVNCYTTPPLVTVDNNNQVTAGAPIAGTSGEPAGTTIRVYTAANVLVATTAVQANGAWSTGNAGTTPAVYNAVAGTTYYATAQNGTCGVSGNSANAAAAAATDAARCGALLGPVSADAHSISGTLTGALANTRVSLYLDGMLIGTTTTDVATWGPIAVNTTTDNWLYGNGVLTIGVQEPGKQEVGCPAALPISCTAPTQPIVTQDNTTILQGQTQTYTIENPVAGVFYGIADAATGRSLATGVWATSATPINITTDPVTTPGAVSVVIKATSLTATEMCSITSASKTLTVNPVSLPMALLEFKARKAGSTHVLTWQTVSEIAASHFEVERSTDGTTYATLGVKPVQGSHTAYAFTDHQPGPAVNYYRLKMVDLDGSFTYSKVVVLRGEGASVMVTVIHPNPFVSEISLSLFLPRAQNLQLVLVDESGRHILTRGVKGAQGLNNLQLPALDRLGKGVYVLKIVTEEAVLQHKLLKVN